MLNHQDPTHADYDESKMTQSAKGEQVTRYNSMTFCPGTRGWLACAAPYLNEHEIKKKLRKKSHLLSFPRH